MNVSKDHVNGHGTRRSVLRDLPITNKSKDSFVGSLNATIV